MEAILINTSINRITFLLPNFRPWSVEGKNRIYSTTPRQFLIDFRSREKIMDIFRKAKSIRMVSYRDKYLTAEDDKENVIQYDEEGTPQSVWTVELVEGRDAVRLRSCYGTYLTASTIPLLPGVAARKAVQTSPSPSEPDPAVEWEPLRDGMQVKLRSWCGNFLRPNGGLPPWRNVVTHDLPHLPNSANKLLWDVEIVEKRTAIGKFGRCRSGSFSECMEAIMSSQEYI